MEKKRTIRTIMAVLIALLGIGSTTFAGQVIFVDADSTGANNGLTWTDAYNYLQDGLAAATSGDEIRVAQGVYKPDQGGGNTPGDRTATFQLENGVTIKGGYAGFGEPDPNARDITTYETILSGDLNGDDGPDFANNGENSYHVVTTDAPSVLDGVTISGGNADVFDFGLSGGGMLISDEHDGPVLTNCTFRGNFASSYGGGISNAGDTTLINCTFSANSASYGGGISGGQPTLIDCTFIGNSASTHGGAMYNDVVFPSLTNCKFTGNSAQRDGGAIYNWECWGSPGIAMTNCLFASNSAQDGGALFNGDTTLKLTNCVFFGNSAGQGADMYNSYSELELTGCIIWGNSDNAGDDMSAQTLGGTTTINYCCIQGGASGGTGNIGDDPLFADPCNGDYHLQGASPCIDTGDPNYVPGPGETDLDGNPRIINGRIDMGAYEFQGPHNLYVDDNATGANNGSSWDDAFTNLQDAIEASYPGAKILVAQGTYIPTGLCRTFCVSSTVAIMGGYAGVGAPNPDARDVDSYKTIFTEGPDELVWGADPLVLQTASPCGGNDSHMVTVIDTNGTATLSGITFIESAAVQVEYNGAIIITDCIFRNDSGSSGRAVDSSGALTLTNCTFDGYKTNGSGGAVYLTRGDAEVTNCTFKDNYAGWGGGGLATQGANAILTNCSFSGNSSGLNGGGLCFDGRSYSIIRCTFNNNWAPRGGAVWSIDCQISGQNVPTMTNCIFSGNSASQDGGAVFLSCSSPQISNCTFDDNSANNYGGAVYIEDCGAPTFTACSLTKNNAKRGGAIYNTYAPLVLSECILVSNQAEYAGAIDSDGDTTLTNCLLANNQALVWGGALANMENTSKSTNCTFVGNSANQGGAIFSNIECDTTALNSIFWDNTAQTGSQIATSGSHGGSTLTVNYCDIENGLNGLDVPDGCTLFWGQGNIDVDSLFVDPNNNNFHLQGVSPCIDAGDPNYVPGPNETDLDGKPRVIGDTVDMGAYESSTSEPGTRRVPAQYETIQAAIDAAADGEVVLVADGTYTGDGNRDIDFKGKAITVRSENGPQTCVIDCQCVDDYPQHRGFYFHNAEGEDSILEGFTIRNGVHGSGGGILCTEGASPTIRNNIIEGNRIPYDFDGGGGIACRNGASPFIVGNVIRNNYCEPGSGGGGIHCYKAGTPRIYYNVITGNHANGGGGIEIAYGTNAATIVGNLIVANDAKWAGAIKSWEANCDLTISNNTIVGNVAEFTFGGIEIKDTSNAVITNCIIWGNRDQNGTIESSQITGSSTNYSCIQGWTGAPEGVGNFGLDPLFIDAGHWDANGTLGDPSDDFWVMGDYHLLQNSPCIDAGDPNFVPGPNETDIEGNERIANGIVDLGAYECAYISARVWYVDESAAGANNGSSWANAFTDLQDAIAASNAGDEIFVAQGTYMPAGPGGSLSASFNIKSGVAIRGGYAGVGAASPDERDIEKYLTVLSGDLNRNDYEEPFRLDDEWFHEDPSRADNCDHVVNGSGTDANAVLEGFTIIGGHGEPYGGGLYNDNGSPTIVDCVFTENTALIGAGMFNTNSSSPALIRCTFERNAICYDYEGGGMVNRNNSNPTLTQCVFRENAALYGRGGGMVNSDSSPVLTHCTFTANIALGASAMFNGGINSPSLSYCNFIDNSGRSAMRNVYYCDATLEFCIFMGNSGDFDSGNFEGGAIDNRCFSNIQLSNCQFIANSCADNGGALYNYDNSSATVTNCLFSGNQAGETGGAVCNQHQCTTTFTNCTFRGNSAPNGKAVACSPYPYGYPQPISEPSIVQIANSILWDGGDEISILDGSAVTVFYNNVFGGWPGIGNINVDPLFVDPNGPDNTSGTEDDNLRLLLGSPCIGAGDNAAVPPSVLTDLDGNPRIVGGTVDMGAYEFSGPIYVDDDAPNDPVPGDPAVSDPLEDGTETHPFDAIQEAIDVAEDGYTVLVLQGSYSESGSGNVIDFLGKNITLTSTDPTDWDVVDNTVIRGYVQFSGTEGPNCKFTGFKIRNIEGAIYGNHTHAAISHCNISGNGPCGATVIKDCDGIISNCLITDNITFFSCGVYPVVFGCNGLIKNCTIANNISGVSVGSAKIENCIIYNNAGSQLGVNSGETLNISYCNLQGGLAGISGGGSVNRGPGNIDTDPCFVRSGYWDDDPWELIEGDYHLRSEGWRWNSESKSWTYDYITSRCLDAGNPGAPLDGELISVPRDPDNMWGVNLRVNMGAFGRTGQASMAPHGWALLADLNNDGTVNFWDFAYQSQDWLKTAPEQPGDLNRDGVVNRIDLAALAENWLKVTDWIE